MFRDRAQPALPAATAVLPAGALMSDDAATADAAVAAADDAADKPRRMTGAAQWMLCLLLLLSAFAMGRRQGFKAGSDEGYWLGVAGGVLMLLLFIYPLRKHWRVLRNIGHTKPWFVAHMLLGIAGPWLILVHSTFHLNSLNATVALLSMMIVALSGAIGRFLYVKVHLGLDGQRAALDELRKQWKEGHAHWDPVLAAAPHVRERLAEFEARANTSEPILGAVAAWRRLYALRRDAQSTVEACKPLLDQAMATLAEPAKPRDRRRLLHVWRAGVREHVGQVLKVAQFSAWERLFALWHVAHVPFVYVMVICAFAHVFAVHAY